VDRSIRTARREFEQVPTRSERFGKAAGRGRGEETAMQHSAAAMPVAFIGHGSPQNAVSANPYTAAWHAFGRSLSPRAILVISAHWYVSGVRVTAAAHPRTVRDFVSFKGPVSTFTYPAPGEPTLAARVQELLEPIPVERDERWGFDHGAWVVLANAFPAADVPVIELSLERSQPPAFHYELARRLAPLRDEGVLIIGSGNIIHNIEVMRSDWDGAPAGWQGRFSRDFRARLDRGDHAALVAYDRLGADAQLAIPTPDHYLPLLYVLALQRTNERPVPIAGDGDDMEGLGMLSFAMA
jgi:4,5-DOPA dioxygenase extradiol